MTSQSEMVSVDPLIGVTDAARDAVLELRAAEDGAEQLALWLEITGSVGDTFSYDLYFGPLSDVSTRDHLHNFGGLPVVVPAQSTEDLRGATLDVVEGDLVVVNPNHPPAPAPPPAGDLSSDLAKRILAVLDEQINPAIASHGGRADLVSVEADTAYLRLSGGCQGCGMAAVTLQQGIEVAIKDLVPEIASVVDVTDHAGGRNPYFEPAKK